MVRARAGASREPFDRACCEWSPLVLVALATAALLVPCALGCGGECRDADGDGYGPGCERGDDCDDGDPRLAVRCDERARACAAEPAAEGCPCLAGARRRCYAGPEDTRDVGICVAGMRHCDHDAWSACEGEVVPTFEDCNALDDDCDGRVDERVQSPCGGCDPQCTGGVWGQRDAPFEADAGLSVTPQGELTLLRAQLGSAFVYVPSAGDGTLRKVDAERAEVVARYALAGEPEHVALDHRDDVFVLSPARAGASWLTKIATEPERCVDRDGDGLETSRGADERLPEGQDECVLWSVAVGEDGEVAHALAIDGTDDPDVPLGGHAWVAFERSARLIQLHGDTGEVLRAVEGLPLSPYAAVFDAFGRLWLLDRGGVLARVDLREQPPEVASIELPLSCYALESLTVDLDGALLMGGLACEDVVGYDPATDRTTKLKLPSVLDARAVAVSGEQAWVTHTGGLLSRLQRAPLRVTDTHALDGEGYAPVDTVALGADAFDRVWAVSTFGAPDGEGVLTRFDPEREEVTAQLAIGLYPRAQGDLTGGQRVRLLAAEASAEHVFEGCALQTPGADGGVSSFATRWRAVHVAADVPGGAELVIEARRASERARLPDATYARLGMLPGDRSPIELELPEGGVLQLRVTLRAADKIGAPRLARVGVQWGCGGPD